jgi:hypothetical protein
MEFEIEDEEENSDLDEVVLPKIIWLGQSRFRIGDNARALTDSC